MPSLLLCVCGKTQITTGFQKKASYTRSVRWISSAIELDYETSKRVDENGNAFRYRAKVRDERGAQVGRWAWDVFLRHDVTYRTPQTH